MSLKSRILGALLIFVSITSIAIIVVGSVTYAYYLPTIVNRQALINHNDTGLTLLDRDGHEFFSFYNAKNKKYVSINSISPNVLNGVVASEDDEFYHHHGFSYRGIARSIIHNFSSGSISFGGSTITQQLVKNTLLSPDRNFVRKFKEIILAMEIEQVYSKKQILEMYLNTSYFGDNSFGIENASQNYFGKKASDLSLAEAAFLVGLLPEPTRLSENVSLAKEHEMLVLKRMEHERMISQAEESNALAYPLSFTSSASDINSFAPHFALFVRDYLISKFGERKIIRSGFQVKTTISSELQKVAENSVAKQIERIKYQGASNGAAVVMDPHNGQVLAMVGSSDWNDNNFGKVNMAVAPRQPGSSFKPIVYALALENGSITPATALQDKPTTFKMTDCYTDCEYKPQNYDRKYRGTVTVRRALANSLNVPAVEVMQRVGVEQVLEKAPQVGIKTLGSDTSKYGLSLVLGTGETSLLSMTNVYATFANEGKAVVPVYITKITDKNGNNESLDSDGSNLSSPWTAQVSYLISSILSDSSARREVFGNSLTISRPAAVKTGTSESYKDAWTIGYTPDVVVGVWVGNNDMRPMNNIAGSLGAAPIWRELMEYYNRGLAVKKFEPPEGIVRIAACGSDDKEATESARVSQEYFIAGTEPSRNCFSIPRSIAFITLTPTPSLEVQTTLAPTVIPSAPDEQPDELSKKEEKQMEKIQKEVENFTSQNPN